MAAAELDVPVEDLDMQSGRIVSNRDASTNIALTSIGKLKKRGLVVGVGYRGPNPEKKTVHPFAAQFCEVEVNTLTGEVRLLRFLGTSESGRVLNRKTFDSQVYGGITMGIGFGMTEMRIFDGKQTGKLVNKNWHDYKLPTMLDVPARMQSLPIDNPDPEANITGAKGLGEPPTIPTGGAIANAVSHATGLRLTKTPLGPLTLGRYLSGTGEEG